MPPTLHSLPPARIAVVTARLIGDALLTTPLVAAVRRRWPGARIEVLGYRGMLGMLDGNPDADACVELDSSGGAIGLLRSARRQGLRRRYDLAFVTQDSGRAHALGWFVARERAGLLSARRRRGWARALYAHAVEPAGDAGARHVADDNLRLLDPWRDAAVVAATAPAVIVPPTGRALPAALAGRLTPGYAVVHAPASAAYKAWPLERFGAVVAALNARGLQCVLTGGPAAADRAAVAAVASAARGGDRVVDACGALDFAQLTTLLGGAALYLGTDTSVTHLAAAVGLPVVALFGPTHPPRWAPLGPAAGGARFAPAASGTQAVANVRLLQGPQACVPCAGQGCEGHAASRSACLDAIPAEAVLAAALRALDAPAAH